ncbi:MAG: archaetidylserine decarboxylase [Myxococcota bacterium]
MLVEILRFVPRRALTGLIGRAARTRVPRRLRGAVYGAFARRVGADLSEADRPLGDYATFQDFFARRLRDGIRPIATDAVVSPVDATVVSAGTVERGRLVQVKGLTYALADLLGGADEAAAYLDGRYATFYLHPRDYHRIHAPIDGRIIASRHVPGGLFPVNPEACAKVPALFATNERLVTTIEGDVGRVAVVKVAALGVGTVRAFYDDAAWEGAGTRRYDPAPSIRRGDELATFLMGSTVVLVAERRVGLRDFAAGTPVRLGEAMGEARAAETDSAKDVASAGR